MVVTGWKRAGISAVALAAVAGLAGCQGGAAEGGKKAGGKAPVPQVQDRAGAARILKAAYKKTVEAKSARVRMTMTMPTGLQGGGSMEMNGTLGWEPTVMDMTVKSQGGLQGAAKGPTQMRMIMLDNVMYVGLPAEQAARLGGKRWMKMDLKAAAELGGGAGMPGMTGGLGNANQDPSRQLGMLLESPNLKHVGAESVEGVPTQHYRGTLSVAEMLKANKDVDQQLSPQERREALTGMRKAGIAGYDTDVWVDDKGYPAKMLIGMKMPQGAVNISMNYSDYGARTAVRAPAAKDTLDFMKLMKEMSKRGGAPKNM
jgi:hypothetical protein